MIIARRVTKQEARYTDAGGREKCAECRFFAPQGWCGKVLGPVSARGWCKYYSREAVQRMSSAGYAGGGAAAPTQDLDFTSGVLPPAVVFSRTTTGTFFDGTGTMQMAAAMAPRFDYDPGALALRGLLIEQTSTNQIRNSMMTGAVPGAPGTLPTNWSLQTTPGLAWSVVGTGVENGITYIDMRLSGTTTNVNPSFIHFDTPGFAASVGQAWSLSFYVKLAAGSLANLTSMSGLIFEQPSGAQHATVAVWPTNGPLAVQRTQNTWTVATAGTTSIQGSFKINVTGTGVPVDCTFRVGGMQTEQSLFPTSFIPTSTVAVQRTQDNATVPNGAWLSATTHTLEEDYIVPYSSLPAGTTAVGVALDDVSFANQYVIRNAGPGSSLNAGAFSGNAQVGTSAGQPFAPWMVIKAASTFDSVGLAGNAVFNGGAPVAWTFTAAPLALTRLVVGIGRSGLLNGWARRVRYWPRVLSVAEMQAATTSDPFTVDFTINGEWDPRLIVTRNSIATYFDSTGVMQSAALHTPRQDFDPVSLVLRGMLIEETRVNSIPNSTMTGAVAGSPGTDPTGWAAALGGLTKTIVGVGVENGITYIDYRFNAAAGAGGNLNIVMSAASTAGIAASAAQAYTSSLYVSLRAGSFSGFPGSTFNLNQWDSGGGNLGAQTSGNYPLAVLIAGDPLVKTRRSFTFTTPANTAFLQPFYRLNVPAGAVDFTLRIGAPQLEQGAFVTSFIPTSSASAQRIGDITQITNAPLPAASGTMLAEVFLPQVPTANANIEFAFLDQGTANDAMGVRQAGIAGLAQITYWVGNSNQLSAGIPGGALNAGAVNKVALTWNRADLSAGGTANGATPITGTAGALPTPTRMTFGSGRNNLINGHIRKVTVWPRVLSAAELQQVTT